MRPQARGTDPEAEVQALGRETGVPRRSGPLQRKPYRVIKGPRAVNRIAPLIYGRLVRLPRFLWMSERHESIAEKILRSRPVGRELRSAVCGFGEACMQQCLRRANSILITEFSPSISSAKARFTRYRTRTAAGACCSVTAVNAAANLCDASFNASIAAVCEVEAGKFHKRCSKSVLQRLHPWKISRGLCETPRPRRQQSHGGRCGLQIQGARARPDGRNDHRPVLELRG